MGHARCAHGHELRVDAIRSRLDVYALFRRARHLGGSLGRLARTGGTAQGRCRVCPVLVRRNGNRSAGRGLASALAYVDRLRHHRRHRAWPRLHLARVDVDQVVPGPSRHGDRNGDHGLRRRRSYRFPLGSPPHRWLQRKRALCRRFRLFWLQDRYVTRRLGNLSRNGCESISCS